MEEIIKALGWPHFSFLFALVFVLLFRNQLAGLISRITSIDKFGVKAAPTPEAQREKQKTEAVQELLLAIGDSIVLRDVEGRIKSDLKERGLETEGDTIKVLIKHLGAAKVLLEVVTHFEHVKDIFKKDFGDWSFDQYMAFLIGRSLVTVDRDTYHISNLGVEYLTWMTRNGRSENRPL